MSDQMQTVDIPVLPSSPEEVNKMIKEHSDLFSDSQCKVCNAVLISESQKLTHYQSKKHANKMRRYLSLQNDKEPEVKKMKTSPNIPDCNNGDTDRNKMCPLCNMTFFSPVIAESHYKGKVHAKKLKLTMGGDQTPAQNAPAAQPKKKPAEDVSVSDNSDDPDRFCSVCQAPFNNPLMARQHYEGKKHRKRMTKLKLMETYGPSSSRVNTQQGYRCGPCMIELNSVEQYQSHVSGSKHKNQLKKLGMNPAENKNAAEQTEVSENQVTEGDADEQFAASEDQFTTGGDQYAAGAEQFDSVDFQFGAADMMYTGGGDQYTPEDKQYSEEYQYT